MCCFCCFFTAAACRRSSGPSKGGVGTRVSPATADTGGGREAAMALGARHANRGTMLGGGVRQPATLLGRGGGAARGVAGPHECGGLFLAGSSRELARGPKTSPKSDLCKALFPAGSTRFRSRHLARHPAAARLHHHAAAAAATVVTAAATAAGRCRPRPCSSIRGPCPRQRDVRGTQHCYRLPPPPSRGLFWCSLHLSFVCSESPLSRPSLVTSL